MRLPVHPSAVVRGFSRSLVTVTEPLFPGEAERLCYRYPSLGIAETGHRRPEAGRRIGARRSFTHRPRSGDSLISEIQS